MNRDEHQTPSDPEKESLHGFESRLQGFSPASVSSDLEEKLLLIAECPDARAEDRVIEASSSFRDQGDPISQRSAWRGAASLAAALVLLGTVAFVLLKALPGSSSSTGDIASNTSTATQGAQGNLVATIPSPASPVSYRFEPSARHTRLFGAVPGSVRIDDAGQPVREIEIRYLDEQEWVEAGTGSVFRFSAPRTEKVVQPIQVF